jgi:hypothetical protein
VAALVDSEVAWRWVDVSRVVASHGRSCDCPALILLLCLNSLDLPLPSRYTHHRMAMNHEDAAAELHATIQQQTAPVHHHHAEDATGAPLPVVEKAGFEDAEFGSAYSGEEEPTEHDKKTLRRIGDKFPASAYLIAVVELCERFTCMHDDLDQSDGVY